MMYFKPREFKCGCGVCGMGLADMDERMIQRLDLARSIAKVPFVITSAIRCLKHNKDVGGIDDSAHLKGHAADIECSDSRKRFLIIEALLRVGFNRIMIYDNFIHVDNDETKPAQVMWIDGS